MGKDNQDISTLSEVNKTLLSATLHNCKDITPDIDASEVIANKADVQWTYIKTQGLVGHIA